MCGIAGIIGVFETHQLDALLLSQHHRGPDATGNYIDKKLFAGRYRFGVNPFFCIQEKDFFYFSFEVKAIHAAGISKIPNEKVWAFYFVYNSYGNHDEFFLADFVTIHIPDNRENEHFVNEGLLSYTKNHFILINTSRGSVWDEKAVLKLLQQKKIKGVAVDVLENELDSSALSLNPLVLLAKENYNIIITPHIAGATYESMAMTEEYVAHKFI